jgi:hypothetical protein
VKEKSKYFLRDNYKKVYKKLALIKTNDSLQDLHEIKRIIKKRRDKSLCELNISQNIVYLWISESEVAFRQKSLLSCPQNYIQLILFNLLTKPY